MTQNIFAALNGIAVGFNAAGLVFLGREETWFMWLGVVVCGLLMVQSIAKSRSR